MAIKRMFSKTITNSSNFLMMPSSSQNLYFHLGMNADDDGFCEHFTVMRMTDSKPDDLKVLQAKGFIKVFDDKVLVIIDWKENNNIRNDRYTPSKYLEIYKEELKIISECNTNGIPSGNQMGDKMDTQYRLDKSSIDKSSIYILQTKSAENKKPNEINTLIEMFEPINPSFKRLYPNKSQRSALERMIKEHGYEKLVELLKVLPEIVTQKYAPTVTTPITLENKLGDLMLFINKNKKIGVIKV